MDNLTIDQRSKNMKRIKSQDTSIELLLRKKLWHLGYRYRKNYNKLPGKPDIVFLKVKIAVFCDSDFWHGRNFDESSFLKTSNKEYWINKIQRNIEIDFEVDYALSSLGYRII